MLFLARALRVRHITPREVEKALLILAWGTTILSVIIRHCDTPIRLRRLRRIRPPTMDGGELSLQVYFILFGVLYFAFRGFRTGRARDYLLALLLFGGSSSRQGLRQTTLTLLLTFFFLVFRWTSWKRLLVLVPHMLLWLALLVGFLLVAMPETMAEQAGKFQDAFTVVPTGERVEDASATGCIGEAIFALEGIAKHPITGNGVLSNQW